MAGGHHAITGAVQHIQVFQLAVERVRSLNREHSRRQPPIALSPFQVRSEFGGGFNQRKAAPRSYRERMQPLRLIHGPSRQTFPRPGRPSLQQRQPENIVALVVIAFDVQAVRCLGRQREQSSIRRPHQHFVLALIHQPRTPANENNHETCNYKQHRNQLAHKSPRWALTFYTVLKNRLSAVVLRTAVPLWLGPFPRHQIEVPLWPGIISTAFRAHRGTMPQNSSPPHPCHCAMRATPFPPPLVDNRG